MDALRLLGSLLGNNATSSGVGSQILGQLVNSLTGSGSRSGETGYGGGSDLAGMLGGLTGGSGLQSRGTSRGGADMTALLGGLAMTALQMFNQRGAASGQSPLAGLASGLGFSQPAELDTEQAKPQANQQALVYVRAMINAAKADGQIDANEQQKIISKLADADPEEKAFIHEEITKPMSFNFLGDVSPDIAPQIYAVSLMAINLDTPAESSYMQQLAQGLGLDAETVNSIHGQLGLAPLYG